MDEVDSNFKGERYSHTAYAHKFDAIHVPGVFKPGLGCDDVIHLGGNSGYQAINLAYLMGAKEINLIGFDMQRTNNMSHWHGDHPRQCINQSPYHAWLKNFDQLSKDLNDLNIDVTNYTRVTALKCFKKGNFICAS